MAYQTFNELSSQVQIETDIESEEFIQPSELINYFNTGIRMVEAEIIKLGLREKYLQTEAFISLVQNQQDYLLPADIVANKIRKVVYRDGVTIYTLTPYKSEMAYEGEEVLNLYQSGTDYYQYMLYKIGEDQQFRVVPRANRSITNAIRIIYFKSLNRFVTGTENCDVPDICLDYLMSYVRYRIYHKEGNTRAPDERQTMDDNLKLMRDTLQNQIADPDNDLIDLDLSHYEEMN